MSVITRVVQQYLREHPGAVWQDLVRDLGMTPIAAQWALV
jgi:hypothetical protein